MKCVAREAETPDILDCMSKKLILFFATVGMIGGSYVPVLLGDRELLSGWSILGGLIGGIAGIWIGAVFIKRWGV